MTRELSPMKYGVFCFGVLASADSVSTTPFLIGLFCARRLAMPRIRTIKPEFWQDEKLAECSPHARLLAIAILQLCDSNGVFRHIPMQIHAHAFPWEAEVKTPALLRELESIGYLFFYAVEGREYGYIPGFAKHQRLSGKEAQSDGLFPLPEQQDTTGEAEGKNPMLPHEAEGKAGTGNREQGIGNSADNKKPSSRRFQKPSVEEVATYCRERGNSINPQSFVDYYQAKGWMIGKNPMKDWKAAVRTWEQRSGAQGGSVSGRKPL